MAAVSIRQLRDGLGEHLRRVQAGQHITVLDGGRPIAEISPIRAEPSTLDERLAVLAAAGEITLPRGKKGRTRSQPARVRGRPVADTLLEDRD